MIQEAGAEARPPVSSFRESAPLIYKPIDVGSFAEYKPTGAFIKAEHDVVSSSDWGSRITSLELGMRNLMSKLETLLYGSSSQSSSRLPYQGAGSELEIRQELRNHALQLAALQQELNEMRRNIGMRKEGPYGRNPSTWG